ncbi:MAG: hypothetical protein AAF960_20780 [Bacteroidota bacterium]
MEFWNKVVNVSKQAAEQQIAIVNTFSAEKRMKIALDFANFGIERIRNWIKENHPNFSELEINLEWVRLMYYEKGEMSEEMWLFYKSRMEKKIRQDWSDRFRRMMDENNWTYEDIAKMSDFKNGKVIEATISRGLPSFAKLAVSIYEKTKKKNFK